jgi:hypothetical protein
MQHRAALSVWIWEGDLADKLPWEQRPLPALSYKRDKTSHVVGDKPSRKKEETNIYEECVQ